MFSPLQTQWVHNEQSSKRLGSNLLIYLAAPQGFEPRYADPESAVLPLNEGAATFAGASILWVDAALVNFGDSLRAQRAFWLKF